MKHNIAIFASGTGTNAEKIIEYFKKNKKINVSLIVSNKSTARVLEIAKNHGIPALVVKRSDLNTNQNILKKLNNYQVDYVVLAGFLILIPTYLVESFENKIINIHPALLPKYGGRGMYGMNVHKAVHTAKEKETGITIHYVNERYDEGAIIFQAKCSLDSTDTPERIAKKVQKLEHQYFPKVIERVILDRRKIGL